MKRIAQFWKSGRIPKIITILTAIITLCCCCFGAFIAFPTPSTPATSVTASILPEVTRVQPTPTLEQSSDTPIPASITPSITPFPLSSESLTPTIPIVLSTSSIQDSSLRVSFIDVGQGDAILIQTEEGKTALVDGGDIDSPIVGYLKSIGIQSIDLVIATHPHSDHIGGLVGVLKTFPVKRVITNGELHTTDVFENFLDAIDSAKAEYVEAKRGDLIELGSLQILVFNPSGKTNTDLNENSLVLRFTYGATTFLLMGDAGADTEADLLMSGLPLKADVLKVGHHGSAGGSTLSFLNAVKPAITVYMAGVGNNYGHPAPQTVSALTKVGATIYGTDKNGTVVVDVDPLGYKVQTQKSGIITAPVFASATPAATSPASFSGLEIVSVTSPVSKGSNATLTAKTAPNASCSITVYYKSGPSSAAGLGPRSADANGMVSWSWKVGNRTTSGTWRIVVTCNQITKETTFTVQ